MIDRLVLWDGPIEVGVGRDGALYVHYMGEDKFPKSGRLELGPIGSASMVRAFSAMRAAIDSTRNYK